MASTTSSARRSSTISQLIHEIINNKHNEAAFDDLDQLIASIDTFLAPSTANKGRSSGTEESRADFFSSASGAANISQPISNTVEILAKKISEYAEKEESAVISLLRAAGNIHWADLCLLLVAAALNRLDIINSNKMETLSLLDSMNELAKEVRKLKGIAGAKDEMVTQINDSIAVIVRGAILCCSQKTTKGIKRLWNVPKPENDLKALQSRVKETYYSLSIQKNSLICNQPESASNRGTNESAQPIESSGHREIFISKDVFLSHSGKQKSFVELLYKDLTNQGVSCFFDRDAESLPPGEDFPSRIFEAAKTCKVAVLLLSMDFLQSKWPMTELATFVEARDITHTNPILKILPFFFHISPDALKSIKPVIKKWKQLGVSEEDRTKWCNALKVVRRSNGLKFSKGDYEGEFIDKIVKEIWNIITPSPRYHVRQTQELERMCQEVSYLFNKIHSDNRGIRMAGLYGMPAFGKTLVGKAFCNIKLGEFGGKVCHLEFSSGDQLQRVKIALQYLCHCPSWILETLTNTDQAKVEFYKRIVGRRVLLVLENITEENIDEVRYFSEAELGKDSCILLSARSSDVFVKHFNVDKQTCMRFPANLETEEALEILLDRIRTEESIFGVHKQIGEVVKRLQWENDAPSIAVIVHGIGGAGKTTLADAVYDFWRCNRKGWKYSKISLPQDLKEYPTVRELQCFILQDLTGKKEEVRDSESGRQRIKEVLGKESIFLYIDNALFRERLQELLPREITNPCKLRLLLTARKTSISQVLENCRVKYEIYSIESLPPDAAIEVLRRRISPEKNTNSLLAERPKLKMIAQKCSCCPLFLEVVGGFLRRRRNENEAYERVLQWMEIGEPFSGDREDRFDEERIMFAYDQLEENAQEAFLDICSFFYARQEHSREQWDWDEVACIVGEEEMECLEEGALIKKKNEISDYGDTIKIRIGISIHDLLLSVGCNKSRNNRYRNPYEFMKVMQDDKLLHQIKGVWLDTYYCEFQGPVHVRAEALDAMSGSLRIFAMDKWTFVEGKCTQRFDQLRFVEAGEGSSLPMDISNLPRLNYIKCSLKDNTKLDARKLPSALKVVNVSSPPQCWNFNEICEGLYLNKLWQLHLHGYEGTGILNFVKLNHLRRLRLSGCHNLMELPESLGRLSSLEQLCLTCCTSLKRLPVGFGNLKALVHLNLCGCVSLEELPMDFEKLVSLRFLDLSYCYKLARLPRNFEKLASLHFLILLCCSELVRLPEGLGNLACLRKINFSYCRKLSSLPQSLGGMTSLSRISIDSCSSLTELPEETSLFSGNRHISFRGLSSLKILPNQFSQLTCLTVLDLGECESIQELCNDFHRLEVLAELYLRRCSTLSTLPRGFGKLKSLQTLDLSECDKLEELCIDFHCLGALKTLYLSGCVSLTKLPEHFGQLLCLEVADLSGCSNLANLCNDFHCLGALKKLSLRNCSSLTKLPEYFGGLVSLENADLSGCCNLANLSNDFHTLPSLLRLNLCNCKRLGAEWMDVVGATQSLCYVDISGNEGMTHRWNEMQKEREQWDLAVVTASSFKDIKKNLWPLILEKAMWRIFSKAGLQIASLQSAHVRLILITERYPVRPEVWEMVERHLERLQYLSKESAIIYIGKQIPSQLADRTVAHLHNFDSFLDSFHDVLPHSFYPAVFMASTIINLERNSVQYLSTWEDISYISDEIEFLSRNPSGSNVQLLKKLIETPETDFILCNDEQVKVKDLKGKVVLVLGDRNDLKTSALKDVYLNLQRSSDNPFEVVFIPWVTKVTDPKEYIRVVTNAPWLVVPKPWLIRPPTTLMVIDDNGSILHKDPMPMILRWGTKAYPFSTHREVELRELEWKEFNLSTQSSLEFVFHSTEIFQSKGIEAIIEGEMLFLCVGPIDKMLEFSPQLNDALTRLKNVIHVLYITQKQYPSVEEINEYETKRKDLCNITSMSIYDAHKFGQRIENLWDELITQGVIERIVHLRRMVLALFSATTRSIEFQEKWKGISIIAVDEKGEMINERCEEVVELLCHSDEEERHDRLMREIESEGLCNVLQKRLTIYHESHPHHPLVRFYAWRYSRRERDIRCDTCFDHIDCLSIHYQCTMCVNYNMCKNCFQQ